MSPRPTLLLLLVLAVGATTLAGCGRKGAPQAPPGEEANFVFPRTYPDPSSLVPGSDRLSTPPAPTFPGQSFGSERTRTIVIQSQ